MSDGASRWPSTAPALQPPHVTSLFSPRILPGNVRRDPPDDVLANIHLKGVAFRVVKDYVIREKGQAAWDRVLAALPPDTRKVVSGRILDSQWVPMVHVNRFSLQAERLLGTGDGSLLREFGRQAATETFSGVYRAFARLLHPKTVLKRVNTMYRSYSDSGHFDTAIKGDDVTLTLVEVPTAWATCQIITGFTERMVANLNKDATIRQIACQSEGHPNCAWVVHYPGLSGMLDEDVKEDAED